MKTNHSFKEFIWMKKLILPTLSTFLMGAVVFGALLFLPAGTFNYWQAWVFIIVFNLSANAIGVYLSLSDPQLLERRKKFGPAQETNPAQKIIMVITLIGCAGLLIVPALDTRFGWSHMPALIPWLGDALIVLSFYFFYRVFKENSFGGSTVETFDQQQVISTGPYALVRHPMYASVLVMVTGAPLALGSWWGLLVIPLTLAALVWRILDEEQLLTRDLPGYRAYMQKVHYRLAHYFG
jgi:protein-S-isoprenylcysteine O-methyltransferase Ste14